MASRKAEKEARRQARLEAERAQAEAAAKKKRITMLAGIVAVAVAMIVALIVFTTSGSDQPAPIKGTPKGKAETASLLAGLPQEGDRIGNPNAPLSMVEFADLKCPVCQRFDSKVMPTLLRDYVRSGKLQIRLKLLGFVGDNNPATRGDSAPAAKFAIAAQAQKRYWNFTQLWYFNQRDETTVYAANPSFLTWIGQGAGVNTQQAFANQNKPWVNKIFTDYADQFSQIGGTGTPTVLLGKTGKEPEQVDFNSIGFDNVKNFTDLVDAKLKG